MKAVLIRRSDKRLLQTVVLRDDGRHRFEQMDPEVGPRLRVDGVLPGWEDATYAVVPFVPFALPEGKVRDGAITAAYDAETGSVVETAPLADAPAAPPRQIAKATIVDRLTDQQLEAALAAMSPRQRERWRMPGYPMINVDDPEMLALLAWLGLDQAAIDALLAVED